MAVKRYAGLIQKATASAWYLKVWKRCGPDRLPLAQRFQQSRICVFRNEPYQDYVRETIDKPMAGELDAQLVYRKRLRRPYMSTNVTFRRLRRPLADEQTVPGRPAQYIRIAAP